MGSVAGSHTRAPRCRVRSRKYSPPDLRSRFAVTHDVLIAGSGPTGPSRLATKCPASTPENHPLLGRWAPDVSLTTTNGRIIRLAELMHLVGNPVRTG